MKIEKKLKASKRGITFSFDGFGKFSPGKKYRYILDRDNNKLLIIPVENDEKGLKISRKKGKGKIKALFDLRSKEIREVIGNAQFLEVKITDDEIVVSAYQKIKSSVTKKVTSLSSQLHHIASYRVAPELLKASGYTGAFQQLSLEDVFGSLYEQNVTISNDVKRNLPQVLKVISLFSGAGMLDYPFHTDDNFEIVYAAEYNEDAVKTYRKNIGNHIHQLDIRTLKGSDLPNADVMIAGPPCQPYSGENHSEKKSENHEEGDMLKEYIRLIRETDMKLFFIENVPKFLTDSFSENMRYIKEHLPEYEITAKVVTDSDVGGYTNRKRAFVFGSRIGKVEIPNLVMRPVKTVHDALKKVTDKWANYYDITKSGDDVQKRISLIPEGGNWEDLPEEYRTKAVHSNMYRRLDRNQPSVTICNWRKYLLSPPKYDSSDYWDRILSVAEAAALSGLDKDFCFYGKLSSKQQQVGNGVPYALGKFVKRIIKKTYDTYNVISQANMIKAFAD
jgi:DNA (cytosine-5)-methyltransferase 1